MMKSEGPGWNHAGREPPLTIEGARVIDPARGIDEVRGVAVTNGRMVKPGAADAGRCVHLDGLVVCPGFIDLHVHLRDPGQTWKEDVDSGTKAAAAGGFSTVVAMPNTDPPLDTPGLVADFRRYCNRTAWVRVLPTGCITSGRKGETPVDAVAMKAAGAVALTDDGACVASSRVMREAMQGAARAGIPVLDHCEDPELADHGVFNDGAASMLNVVPRPAVAEDLMVARDIVLALETGCRVHLQHLSSARSVDLLMWGKEQGATVSAEVTPHHLALTEEACVRLRSLARMNPPLRTERDQRRLRLGLLEGVIEAIATDHAPHSPEEKARPLADAPAGVIGLETAVSVGLTMLVHGGVMSLSQLIARFTAGPRRILGLAQGTLAPGAPADLVVLDPDVEFEIRPGEFLSKSRNTPFAGMRCKGRVLALMVGGRWVWSRIPERTGPGLVPVP